MASCWRRRETVQCSGRRPARSPLELPGGQGGAGSNPVIPTVSLQGSDLEPFGLAVAREDSAGNLRVRGPFRCGGAALLVARVPKWVPKYALDEHGRREMSRRSSGPVA